VTIGVTHAPYRRVLDAFVTYGANAIFGGHTHGGQVRVPGLPALVTNCDIPREQASGLSTWTHAQRTAWLNVSAGLGTSIYAPVRFACPPEAVIVTLTPSDIGYS
jgi:predicted MPP superfamily phosphohydrolase